MSKICVSFVTMRLRPPSNMASSPPGFRWPSSSSWEPRLQPEHDLHLGADRAQIGVRATADM